MSLPPLLRLTQVSKCYVSGNETLRVLDGISLNISQGETLAIVGPSGSGKSTLLNIIGTLDKPTEGKFFFENEDLSLRNDEQLAQIRNQQIGFIFQSHHLLPQCTALENVLVPTLANKDKSTRKDAHARAVTLLKRVGLDQRLNHFPGQLSGGERQRTAVVRALINNPKLLLADEPTGSLDSKAAKELTQLLLELNQEQRVTLILVTHAPDLAVQMRRQLEIQDGKLV